MRHPAKVQNRGVIEFGLVLAFFVFLLCGCGPSPLSETEIMTRLTNAGFSLERLDKILISQGSLDRLPPTQEAFSFRISDQNGNRDQMTLLRYKNASKAADADKSGVNGFAVRNCFFAGIIPDHFESPIKEALK